MRADAERAAKWGGIACLLQAARTTIGNIASVSVADKPLDNAIAWFIGASIIPVFFVVAGIRLWRHEGWIWGGLVALIIALDFVLFGHQPLSINGVPVNAVVATIVKVALLTLIINGVRGALALRNIGSSDLSDAFE